MTATERLAGLQDELAKLRYRERQARLDEERARSDVRDLTAERRELQAAELGGRDVTAALAAVTKQLAKATKHADQPWAEQIAVARRAVEIKQADVAAFATANYSALAGSIRVRAQAETVQLAQAVEELRARLTARAQLWSELNTVLGLADGHVPAHELPEDHAFAGLDRALREATDGGIHAPDVRGEPEKPDTTNDWVEHARKEFPDA